MRLIGFDDGIRALTAFSSQTYDLVLLRPGLAEEGWPGGVALDAAEGFNRSGTDRHGAR